MQTSFAEFPTMGLDQWKAKLEKELKPPFDLQKLNWQVSDSFSLEPLYGPEIQTENDLQYLKNFHKTWKDSRKAKRAAISVGSHAMLNQSDQTWKLAEGYGFQSWFGPGPKSGNPGILPFYSRNGGHETDPVMDGLAQGKWLGKNNETPKTWHIHGDDVQEAGGNPVQELASLLLVSDYYVSDLAEWPEVVWHLGIGTSFWLELAKCRAARLLWMNFAAFHKKDFKAFSLIGKTSSLFWSSKDVDVNLIRHSTEVMAGIMGGVDEIRILPHSLDPDKALESTRLAANMALLCYEESHLDDHFDPASGSYWVEKATDALAKAAWEKFIFWQKAGIENLVRSGEWVSEIEGTGKKLKEEIQSKSKVWIGENAFVNELAQKSPGLENNKRSETSDFKPLVHLDLSA